MPRIYRKARKYKPRYTMKRRYVRSRPVPGYSQRASSMMKRTFGPPTRKGGKVGGISRGNGQDADCVLAYASVQTTPFAQLNENACVPDVIAVPSNKVSMHIKGQFTIGSDRAGWVTFDPYLFGNGPSTGYANNDAWAPVWSTTSAAVAYDNLGNVIDQNLRQAGGAAPAGYQAYYTDGDYTTGEIQNAIINANIDYRVVGAGLKAQYIGPPLTRQGQMLLFEDPSNAGAVQTSQIAVSTLLNQNATTTGGVDEHEHEVVWHPREQDDLTYAGRWLGGTYDTATNYDVLIIAVAGGTAGDTYTFDAVLHLEITGFNIPGKTLTYSDVSGLSRVLSNIPVRPTWNMSTNKMRFKAKAQSLGAHIPYLYGSAAKQVKSGARPGGWIDISEGGFPRYYNPSTGMESSYSDGRFAVRARGNIPGYVHQEGFNDWGDSKPR